MKYSNSTKAISAFTIIEMSFVILIIMIMISGVVSGIKLRKAAVLNKAQSLTASSPVNGTDSLILWLEPTSRDSFSVINPVDGDVITVWKDTNPQTLVKSDASGTATYTKNVINSLPALKFSSSNYLVANVVVNNSGLTVFVVASRIAASTNTSTVSFYNPTVSGQDYNNTAVAVLAYESGGGMLQSYRVAAKSTAANPGNNVPYIFDTVFDGTNNTAYLNGVQQTTVASTGNFNISQVVLGARYNNSGFTSYYNGYIGEFILFDRALTDKERRAIEVYLSDKWGITIS